MAMLYWMRLPLAIASSPLSAILNDGHWWPSGAYTELYPSFRHTNIFWHVLMSFWCFLELVNHWSYWFALWLMRFIAVLLKVLHQTPIDAFSWWGSVWWGSRGWIIFTGIGLCTSNQPLGFWASTCYQASLACQNCRFTVDGGYMMIYAPLMFFGGFDPALIIVWLCMSLLPGRGPNIWLTDFQAPHLLEMLLKAWANCPRWREHWQFFSCDFGLDGKSHGLCFGWKNVVVSCNFLKEMWTHSSIKLPSR